MVNIIIIEIRQTPPATINHTKYDFLLTGNFSSGLINIKWGVIFSVFFSNDKTGQYLVKNNLPNPIKVSSGHPSYNLISDKSPILH